MCFFPGLYDAGTLSFLPFKLAKPAVNDCFGAEKLTNILNGVANLKPTSGQIPKYPPSLRIAVTCYKKMECWFRHAADNSKKNDSIQTESTANNKVPSTILKYTGLIRKWI